MPRFAALVRHLDHSHSKNSEASSPASVVHCLRISLTGFGSRGRCDIIPTIDISGDASDLDPSGCQPGIKRLDRLAREINDRVVIRHRRLGTSNVGDKRGAVAVLDRRLDGELLFA